MDVISTPRSNARKALDQLGRPAERRFGELAFRGLLLFGTIIACLVLGVLLVSVGMDGIPRLNAAFLTEYSSRFADETGIRAQLTGTLSLMVLVALIACPIGVGAAIYLEEFAPRNRFTRLIEVNIANLAGVPSIVYGLLGLAVFVYFLSVGRHLLAGAATLALLVLPVIIVAGREAIKAVPQEIRAGGLALGATRWQVASRQVLPAALPGMLTGTILSLSRAIGETAPLLAVGAAFSIRQNVKPWELFSDFSALPIVIYQYASFPGEDFRVEAASAGIVVLLAVLLLMNSVAIVLRNRYSRRT
ncbi:MAG: phosphate ABC transporter permease PstA [Egibacteraceae bacterium]